MMRVKDVLRNGSVHFYALCPRNDFHFVHFCFWMNTIVRIPYEWTATEAVLVEKTRENSKEGNEKKKRGGK